MSYAICIGIFAETEEQANGFGAVSIVILAAMGGLMVPDFVMPGISDLAMKFSPSIGVWTRITSFSWKGAN